MSVTEEVQKPTAEQPGSAAKPVKEKKTKAAPREQKPKVTKTASHPPYFEMIKEALLALKEKGGSSPHAIAKYMEEKHKAVLPANFRKMLGLQLKNSATRGKLVKVKASYKLSESEKKDKAAAAKPAAKKIAATEKPKAAKATAAATKKPKAAKATAAATKKPKTAKATAASTKKPKAAKASAAATKKPRAAKASAAATGTKRKAVTKKATPVKAKQPKSIKSPAKRAKRASAAV